MTGRRLSLLVVWLVLSVNPATAGTKVKGSIVAHDASAHAQVSSRSTFSLKGTGEFKVYLRGITNSTGAPVPITTGTTPDTQYWLTVKGDVQGILWQYNVPFNITEAGQARIEGSVSLVSLVPIGSAVGIQGMEVHEPAAVSDVADCTALMNDPQLPGVWISGLSPTPTNPCASGTRIGLTGISTGQ